MGDAVATLCKYKQGDDAAIPLSLKLWRARKKLTRKSDELTIILYNYFGAINLTYLSAAADGIGTIFLLIAGLVVKAS